jgi:hypothetical protein
MSRQSRENTLDRAKAPQPRSRKPRREPKASDGDLPAPAHEHRHDDPHEQRTARHLARPTERHLALRRVAAGASLVLAAAATAAADLAQAVDRLVVQGYEDSPGAQAGLRALQATTPPTPENTRKLLLGFGLVAADNYQPAETAAAARALRARWRRRPAPSPRPTPIWSTPTSSSAARRKRTATSRRAPRWPPIRPVAKPATPRWPRAATASTGFMR